MHVGKCLGYSSWSLTDTFERGLYFDMEALGWKTPTLVSIVILLFIAG